MDATTTRPTDPTTTDSILDLLEDVVEYDVPTTPPAGAGRPIGTVAL